MNIDSKATGEKRRIWRKDKMMVLLSDIMNPTNECRASIANYVRKKVSQLAVLNIPATGVLIA
ncbi:hypothetical protein [Enterovibrio baiacu]|uniref:hypothetical protein n=1 Tax=Enterovibrio baiacu TaxID=2491023 RepID=UPI0010106BBC|nr:hypothetical protein [Enterovibrio baiacu]MBE1275220.1 hypothetical protein [Enterovibrio baiacu]